APRGQGRRRRPCRAGANRAGAGRDELVEPQSARSRKTCAVRTPSFRSRRSSRRPARGARAGARAVRAGPRNGLPVPALGPVVRRGPRLSVFVFVAIALAAFVGLAFTAG